MGSSRAKDTRQEARIRRKRQVCTRSDSGGFGTDGGGSAVDVDSDDNSVIDGKDNQWSMNILLLCDTMGRIQATAYGAIYLKLAREDQARSEEQQ